MMSPRLGLAVAVVAVLLSSLALIQSTHQARAYYAELQRLEGTRWYLQEDYSRLMLERSTLASPHRIAQLAGNDLIMRAPDLDPQFVIVLGAPR
ncbi:MAG: cell division protein FtsL [Luminiphilus sp.]|nr:cell division protein FtsL [Luminiphilus sp.]